MAVVVAVSCAALGGCLSGHTEHTTARLHGPPMAGVVGDDVVYLDFAVLEKPLGDTFFNRELWSETDEEVIRADGEQAVSLERKMALEKNGFRIGQIGGMLPTKLQDLLDSPRSCQARRIQLHAGHETILPLGSPWEHCSCRLARDEELTEVSLDKAQCLLEVVPTLADEGHIRLRFTPRIKHGEAATGFQPVRDADGQMHWGRQEVQSEEVYPWLSWTLTVVPNEYVVLGAFVYNGESLGEQFFLTREENRPIVQRLLVLRAAHVPTPAGPMDDSLGRSPPLALRASLITARGRGE
jgi:hypothetical protein